MQEHQTEQDERHPKRTEPYQAGRTRRMDAGKTGRTALHQAERAERMNARRTGMHLTGRNAGLASPQREHFAGEREGRH